MRSTDACCCCSSWGPWLHELGARSNEVGGLVNMAGGWSNCKALGCAWIVAAPAALGPRRGCGPEVVWFRCNIVLSSDRQVTSSFIARACDV